MTTNFASEAQIKFVSALLDKMAWNDEKVVARKFINRAAIVNIAISWATDPSQLGAGRSSIDAVATSADLGGRVNQIMAHVGTGADQSAEYIYAPLTVKGASNLITWLQSLPVKSEAAKEAGSVAAKHAAAKAEPVELEDGMYMVDGTVYKVQHAVHGSGNQYAKQAFVTDNGDGTFAVSFDYARGAIAKIRPEHKMSYEQAKEFGALYGTCCCCGRTLSNELSIALGIGPVCGEREFGGEFKVIIKEAKLELKAR